MNKDELYKDLEQYFLEKGISEGSFKEFSEQRKISRTSLNYYFKNKDYIYIKILTKILRDFEKKFFTIINNKELSYYERINILLDMYFGITKASLVAGGNPAVSITKSIYSS